MLKLVGGDKGYTIDQLKFKLVPPILDSRLSFDDPELAKLNSTYRICHYAVFGSFPKTPNFSEKLVVSINQLAMECRATVRLYLLASMFAHRESSPERDFYPMLLVTPGAVGRVEHYRAACAKEYGTFDLTAFELMTKADLGRFERALEASEKLFALYASSPACASLKSFYRDFEHSLNEYWCAIEQSYLDEVLIGHVKSPAQCSATIQRKRHAVAMVHSQLKRSRGNAVAVFESRAKVVPRVLAEVAKERGVGHLRFSDNTVVDLAAFWKLLRP